MKHSVRFLATLMILLVATGCLPKKRKLLQPPSSTSALTGTHHVSNRTIMINNTEDNRELAVEIWYPSQTPLTSDNQQTMLDFALNDEQTQILSELIANTPESCIINETRSSQAGQPIAGSPWPWVVFSHCHNCSRFSAFTMAENLASQGFAVVAPGHVNNTIFESNHDTFSTLKNFNTDFLNIRYRDVTAVIDAILDTSVLPAELQNKFSTEQIGMIGHSFGGVTTGMALTRDPRLKAGFIIAAPAAVPIFSGDVLSQDINQPTYFFMAQEDNSITPLGNALMSLNSKNTNAESWLAEVADAGHWSFSNIAGLGATYLAGCGTGFRQTNPEEEFTYIDNELGRSLVSDFSTRFFKATLLNDADAKESLTDDSHPSILSITASP